MDNIKRVYLLLAASVLLCSLSGQQTMAQMSGTVLDANLMNYMTQMLQQASGTGTQTGTGTTTNTGPPTTVAPPPPPPPPANPSQTATTAPAQNQVNNLYQQIMTMMNRNSQPQPSQQIQQTTPPASVPMNPFLNMLMPPTTTTLPPPTTQSSVPFNPWAQPSNTQNTQNSNTNTNPWAQPSNTQNTQNTNTNTNTNTATQNQATTVSGSFRPTAWEQYRPHPDPWSKPAPTRAPAAPKPRAPLTTAEMMQTYVPLRLQERLMNAGRTGFIKPTLYFEEHGCVDPKMALPPGTRTPGLTLSCSSQQSQMVCQQVGAALGGGEAAGGGLNMNSFVMQMMPGYKRLLEKCLSPNIMDKIKMQQQMMMMKMMTSMFQRPSANSMNSMSGGQTGMNSMSGGQTGMNSMMSGGQTGMNSMMSGGQTDMNSMMSGGQTDMNSMMSGGQTGMNSMMSGGQTGTNSMMSGGQTGTNSMMGTGSGNTNPLDALFGATGTASGSTGQPTSTSSTSGTTPQPAPAGATTQPPASMSGPLSNGPSPWEAMFVGQTGTVPGRKKRQASFGIQSLYDSLYRPHMVQGPTLLSGAASIPTGANQQNSISSTSQQSTFGSAGAPQTGSNTGGSLLQSTGGVLPQGAATPSVSSSTTMNAGMGTSPSTGGLMNMMSNMMSGASSQGGSLPVGAASPSSTGGMSSFFGSMFGGAGAGAGAGSGAAAGPEPGIEMCSSILPMLLANAGVEGPLGSPEAMEMMADVRKQMLPMQCQEFPMMNFRMCCPGTVTPPTFQDMMMAGRNAGAK